MNITKYKILTDIHVHAEPKKESEALSLLKKDDIVESINEINDWLLLKEGGYVCFGWGRYAVKIKEN